MLRLRPPGPTGMAQVMGGGFARAAGWIVPSRPRSIATVKFNQSK